MDELVHPGEPLGGNAHDREGNTVETNLLPHCSGVGPKHRSPGRVAQHGHRVAPGYRILLWPEATAEDGLDSQHPEEVSAHQHAQPELGRRLGALGDGERRIAKGHEAAERAGSLPVVEEVRPGEAVEVRAIGGVLGLGAQGHHLPRTRHGQGPEHESVGQAEDGGGSPRPEGEGEGGDQGEAGVLGHHAESEAHVL